MAKLSKQDSGVEMDMTPMIDIVFLLIIFFMIVTELNNLDIVQLILPVADHARVEEPVPGQRAVTVNIRQNEKNPEGGLGEIVVGGDIQTPESLATKLNEEAVMYNKYTPNPNDSSKKDSELEINLRADERINAGHIHEVYQAAQKAKVYKVRLVALNEDLEDRYGED